jgi:hypothetical protein
VIWVWCEEEIFLQRGLDRQVEKLPVGQISQRGPHERRDMRAQRQLHSRISLRSSGLGLPQTLHFLIAMAIMR